MIRLKSFLGKTMAQLNDEIRIDEQKLLNDALKRFLMSNCPVLKDESELFPHPNDKMIRWINWNIKTDLRGDGLVTVSVLRVDQWEKIFYISYKIDMDKFEVTEDVAEIWRDGRIEVQCNKI